MTPDAGIVVRYRCCSISTYLLSMSSQPLYLYRYLILVSGISIMIPPHTFWVKYSILVSASIPDTGLDIGFWCCINRYFTSMSRVLSLSLITQNYVIGYWLVFNQYKQSTSVSVPLHKYFRSMSPVSNLCIVTQFWHCGIDYWLIFYWYKWSTPVLVTNTWYLYQRGYIPRS